MSTTAMTKVQDWTLVLTELEPGLVEVKSDYEGVLSTAHPVFTGAQDLVAATGYTLVKAPYDVGAESPRWFEVNMPLGIDGYPQVRVMKFRVEV